MRDKIRVNDLKILFVCPTENWGTLERRVISDCHYLRDIGGSPMLYCIKGSQIDKEAQKYSLPRYFFKGKKVNKIFDLRYYLDLKSLIKEYKFDLIHCYNLAYTRTICFLLMARPLYPLCLTFNSYLKKEFDNYFDKWLLKRIDLVMTFSDNLKEILISNTAITSKKIYVVGAGLDQNIKQENMDEIKTIGTFISNKEQAARIPDLLHSISGVNGRLGNNNKKAHFFVFTERDTDLVPEADENHKLVSELGINSYVDFVEVDSPSQALKKIDLYVSLCFDEPFSDIEVMSLLNKKAIVIPRTASRSLMLNRFSNVGLSYQQCDSRELRESILEIISNQGKYKGSLDTNFNALKEVHGLESYVEKVYDHYIKLYSQRARFASLKLKSN